MRTLALATGIAALGLTAALATAVTITDTHHGSARNTVEQAPAVDSTSAYLEANFGPGDCAMYLADSAWFLEAVQGSVTEPQLILNMSVVVEFLDAKCSRTV